MKKLVQINNKENKKYMQNAMKYSFVFFMFHTNNFPNHFAKNTPCAKF